MGGILFNDKENFEYNELYDQGITQFFRRCKRERKSQKCRKNGRKIKRREISCIFRC